MKSKGLKEVPRRHWQAKKRLWGILAREILVSQSHQRGFVRCWLLRCFEIDPIGKNHAALASVPEQVSKYKVKGRN
jgi:hypothetical protein